MVWIVDETSNARRLKKKSSEIEEMLGEIFSGRKVGNILHNDAVTCRICAKGIGEVFSVVHYGLSKIDEEGVTVSVDYDASFDDYEKSLEFADRYEKEFGVPVKLRDNSGHYARQIGKN